MGKPSKPRRKTTPPETWIGVVSLLADGETFAIAWLRRRDEWLADAGTAPRGSEILELGRMYLDAVAARGSAPDRLTVRAALHADALRVVIGPGVPIRTGFDRRAEALSDAAAAAIDVAFEAEALVDDADEDNEQGDVARLVVAVEPEYDPEQTPDAATWLARDEDDRQRHIRLAHLAAGEALSGQRLQMHAGMHDAVELQVAQNDPPETAVAVARLCREGVSRHNAVHAVANVLVASLHAVVTSSLPFDRDEYVAALRRLTRDTVE